MYSDETKKQTIREWRNLGFYYDRDDNYRSWILMGSKKGLYKFSELIKNYVNNERNSKLYEHDHYGPYMYLEICTWKEPQITNHWIAGTLNELVNLSNIIDESLKNKNAGEEICIGKEYSPNSEYEIKLIIREDDYDPSSSDPKCI